MNLNKVYDLNKNKMSFWKIENNSLDLNSFNLNFYMYEYRLAEFVLWTFL